MSENNKTLLKKREVKPNSILSSKTALANISPLIFEKKDNIKITVTLAK